MAKENFRVIMIIGIASIVTSLIEMLFLFFDTLNKTYKITQAAHLELFPKKDDEAYIATSIARAALELPNPRKSDININPRKEALKIKIILTGIVYKLKVSLTNMALKLVVKNIFGKAISRSCFINYFDSCCWHLERL